MSENKVYTYWPKNGAVYAGIGAEHMDISRFDGSHEKLGYIPYDASTKKHKIKYGTKTKMALMAMRNGGARTAAIGDTSIDHINAFPLLREMIGKPAEIYHLHEMGKTINVTSLNARIPERDAFKAQLGVKPLQEVDFTNVKYGEDNFNLTYNATPFFHASEDRLRGVIDPMNIDLEESRRALVEARNGLVLNALISLTDTDVLSNDWDAKTSGVSTNNPKKDILDAIMSHWTTYQSRIDTWAVNPADYQRYEANDFVKGYQAGLDVNTNGVTPVRGIPGLTAYLDPMVPLGTVYFIDSQALLKGVGPMQTEQWRRPENNADMGIVRDYVQVILMNPTRFGFKSDLTLTASGDTATVEPTSLEEIKALIGTPTVVANPPTISS